MALLSFPPEFTPMDTGAGIQNQKNGQTPFNYSQRQQCYSITIYNNTLDVLCNFAIQWADKISSFLPGKGYGVAVKNDCTLWPGMGDPSHASPKLCGGEKTQNRGSWAVIFKEKSSPIANFTDESVKE